MVVMIRRSKTLLALAVAAATAGCGGESELDAGKPGAAGVGGASGGGGAGGSGTVVPLPSAPPSAVDLLFVIDNSISMFDKQAILSEAVPLLVQRLITPNCLDAQGVVVGTSDAAGNCALGAAEFAAVPDLHLGVITSSLGSHGGQV
jgi:hypothetical protein